MPEVLSEIEVQYDLLGRLLGVRASAKTEDGASGSTTKVSALKVDEVLMINVGSQSLGGKVVAIRNKETVRIEFTRPVCANKGDKIAMSRRVGNNHRLIGWGKI